MNPIQGRVGLDEIHATCGHILTEAEGLGHGVFYKSADCDAVTGFHPCYVSACYCTSCRDKLRDTDDWLENIEEAEKWLDAQPISEPKF